MTDAERAMWRILRQGFPDHHFRRQVPIRQFIADFCCHKVRLIIEVDGSQHATEVDAPRSAILEEEGYRVIRFWNNEVLGNPDGVWSAIDAALRDGHPTPTPPHQGEGL
jgi:very-short-patch-repair endonuclease